MKKHEHKNKSDMAVVFLLCSILPAWIFFELMPTKIPSRVLLADSYPVKATPGLSDNGNTEQYLLM